MINPVRLERITVEGLPEAVIMRNGAVVFKNFMLSRHAIQRFEERAKRTREDLLKALHTATTAIVSEVSNTKLKWIIVKNENDGLYVLASGDCYFIVKPDGSAGCHTILTVLTPDFLHWQSRDARDDNY